MHAPRPSLAVLAAVLFAPIAAAQTLTVPPGPLVPGTEIDIQVDGGTPGANVDVEVNPFPGGKQQLNVHLDSQGHGSAKWRVPLCTWVVFQFGFLIQLRWVD